MKFKSIKTKRFILRPYRKEDRKDLVESVNDKVVSRYMAVIPYPYGLKDADKFLKKAVQIEKDKIGFAIEIEGKLCGGCGIRRKEHQAEIGYWLAKKCWGKGLATEIAKELVKIGFEKMKLKKITARVFIENKASVRVLEKNGFKLEGTLRKEVFKNGKYHDAFIFAKIK